MFFFRARSKGRMWVENTNSAPSLCKTSVNDIPCGGTMRVGEANKDF